MKKLYTLLVTMAVALSVVAMPAVADTGRYGRVISRNTMEGFNYFTDYAHCTYTREVARSGVRSWEVDFSGNSSGVNLFTNLAKVSPQYCYYSEVYIKFESGGFEVAEQYLWSRSDISSYNNRVGLRATGPKDEEGWQRYAAHSVPVENQQKAGVICYFPKSIADSLGISKMYIDDITIYIAPYRISAQNITASASETVSLKDTIAYGYDKDGNPERLDTSSGISEWKVVSGNGYVDKNANLVCTDKSGGTVTVELTFCGVSTRFNVEFSAGLNISAPKKYANGMTVMTIVNSEETEETVTGMLLLYDKNGRLYDTKTVSKLIAPSSTGNIIVPTINIPYNMTEYTKKMLVTTRFETLEFTLQ